MAEEVPQFHELMVPTLTALKDLGGSATIKELYDKVVENEAFSEEVQERRHGEGRQSELEYRMAWARTHLKAINAAENSARGIWTITEQGRRMTPEEVRAATFQWREHLRRRRQEAEPVDESEEVGGTGEPSWQDRLIEEMLRLSPEGFERMAQRLLREAGFINVTVTRRSGDEGIDGVGVYRLSLVSFPVYFQCKRYRGSVRAGAVRDFRGAMAGRGEKGLLIATDSFTREAQSEASRDGAPPVELIDGEALCDLLKAYNMGVTVTQRIEEDVEVNPVFFEPYRS